MLISVSRALSQAPVYTEPLAQTHSEQNILLLLLLLVQMITNHGAIDRVKVVIDGLVGPRYFTTQWRQLTYSHHCTNVCITDNRNNIELHIPQNIQHVTCIQATSDDRQSRPILSANEIGQQKSVICHPKNRSILSADKII